MEKVKKGLKIIGVSLLAICMVRFMLCLFADTLCSPPKGAPAWEEWSREAEMSMGY